MTTELLVAPVCIICHEQGGDDVALLSRCTCRESVFCDDCWREYLVRGFAMCPVCREPLAREVTETSNVPQEEEATECHIMTSPKLVRRVYFLPLWYTVFLVGVIATSAMEMTTLDSFCLCISAVFMMMRRLVTGNWYVDENDQVVMERTGGLLMPVVMIKSTFIVDVLQFTISLGLLIVDTDLCLVVWTSLQLISLAVSCFAVVMCGSFR